MATMSSSSDRVTHAPLPMKSGDNAHDSDVNPLDSAQTGGDLLQSLFGLEGEVAVITGGGAGLGREMARLFARAGASVVVADLDEAKAQSVASEVEKAGGRAIAIKCNVADEASVAALFKTIGDKFGSATILVNNAGIYPVKPLLEISPDDWSRVMDINLKGTFLCTRAAVAQMQASGRGGRIVNISSIASVHPVLKGYAAYGASKGGINMFTKEVALEVAGSGITVNAVLLGGVKMDGRDPGAGDVQGPATQPGRFPLGEAVAWKHAVVALFVAGPGASHMTGELIVSDGGFLVS